MGVMLGIDIGGSGIKGAQVDLETGALATKRYRIKTPRPATPEAVAKVVTRIVRHFAWTGPFGCGLPAVVRDGVARSAANIDDAWIGTDAAGLFSAATGLGGTVLNDADAAGLAEMRYGSGRDAQGVVLVLTFGSGIGSALFVDGALVPNTELGHLEFRGMDAEHYAAARLVEHDGMDLESWVRRVDEYLRHLTMVLSPSLIIFGGGISKRFATFAPALAGVGVPVVAARLRNNAGIVGAALAAHENTGGRP
jgi:polyphosphate glucokinase